MLVSSLDEMLVYKGLYLDVTIYGFNPRITRLESFLTCEEISQGNVTHRLNFQSLRRGQDEDELL